MPLPVSGRGARVDLCGRKVVVDHSEVAWLWETCPDCNGEARRLAGISGP
ncbi:hypothetical protein [Saccharopolyspora rosea]|nr:hypothetical protein [Saccharopolyspora rosea]